MSDIKRNPLYKRMAKHDAESQIRGMQELKSAVLNYFCDDMPKSKTELESLMNESIEAFKNRMDKFINSINQ